VTYALIGDTSLCGFTVNAATGVVTVADASKIDYESAPGHAYTVTVQATDGALTSSQTFTIGVSDVAPSTPVDSDGATNQVANGAPAGAHAGVTASSADVNGPAVTYSLVGDTSGGGFTINSATGVVTVADPSKIILNPADPKFTITVDASDGTLHSQQTFDINVIVDVPPVANDDSVSATEAGGLNNAVAGVDPAGNVILGTGAAGSVLDTDLEDPSTALTVVAVHTGPEGGSILAGTVGTPLTGAHGTHVPSTSSIPSVNRHGPCRRTPRPSTTPRRLNYDPGAGGADTRHRRSPSTPTICRRQRRCRHHDRGRRADIVQRHRQRHPGSGLDGHQRDHPALPASPSPARLARSTPTPPRPSSATVRSRWSIRTSSSWRSPNTPPSPCPYVTGDAGKPDRQPRRHRQRRQ
jgi:hypothetical protein